MVLGCLSDSPVRVVHILREHLRDLRIRYLRQCEGSRGTELGTLRFAKRKKTCRGEDPAQGFDAGRVADFSQGTTTGDQVFRVLDGIHEGQERLDCLSRVDFGERFDGGDRDGRVLVLSIIEQKRRDARIL